MASKNFPLLKVIILLFFPLLLDALLTYSNDQKPQPFEFLKHLVGCQKSDKIKGIHELKMYLGKFGYLNYNYSLNNQSHVVDDYFDDNLGSAIKTYKLNYDLCATGSLDVKTVSKMMMTRCGVPDSFNDATRMHSGKKMNHLGPNSFHRHYAFFKGEPKWPGVKPILHYGFPPNTRPDAISPVAMALSEWSAISNFSFVQIEDYKNADLKISFESGDHGDGLTFDGRGGVLAHAFAPIDGRFHFDAAEDWAVGGIPNKMDIRTIALHEIGHLLGLEHSSIEKAIMYPTFSLGETKDLQQDDIQGIRNLYYLWGE